MQRKVPEITAHSLTSQVGTGSSSDVLLWALPIRKRTCSGEIGLNDSKEHGLGQGVIRPSYDAIRRHTMLHNAIQRNTKSYNIMRCHTKLYNVIRRHTTSYAYHWIFESLKSLNHRINECYFIFSGSSGCIWATRSSRATRVDDPSKQYYNKI